jgi:hypothetical protein
MVNRIDDGWVIAKHKFVNQRWFGKPVEHTYYTLYHHVIYTEYQVINFAGGDTSIHYNVSKANIINYLNGYVGGYYNGKRNIR